VDESQWEESRFVARPEAGLLGRAESGETINLFHKYSMLFSSMQDFTTLLNYVTLFDNE
jgi:hypothetical protein